MRELKFGFCAFIAILFLNACGANIPELEDNTIRRDLTKNDSLLNESAYVFSVVSRDIDSKARAETLEVTVEGHNDQCTYTAAYRMNYIMVNDSWELSYITNLSKSIEYTSAVDEPIDYETAMENWEKIDPEVVAENVQKAFETIQEKYGE